MMKKKLDKIMENGKAVIVPMDHGMSEGPIAGIGDISSAVARVEKYATAVILHKGLIKSMEKKPECGVIMHASASTRVAHDPNYKVQVAVPEEAVRYKCDGFSLHVNIGGNEHEQEMIQSLAKSVEKCDAIGMPVLAMMYPRGKNIPKATPDDIALVARVGAELGADIIKCPYTGDPDSFRTVTKNCPAPVVIAGGAKSNKEEHVLEMVEGSMIGGGAGISLGRNIFQHEHSELMTMAIRKIVMERMSAAEAMEIIKMSVKIK